LGDINFYGLNLKLLSISCVETGRPLYCHKTVSGAGLILIILLEWNEHGVLIYDNSKPPDH